MIVQLVTDRRRLSTSADFRRQRRCLLRQAELAIDAGVDLIQVREPDLAAGDAVALVRDLVAAAHGTSTRIVVNDRLDVALAAGAHGVHLPARGMRPLDARRLAPRPFIVGVSVHSVEALARTEGADYMLAGTVWPSASKPEGHPTIGVRGLRALVDLAEGSVLAIGGVTTARAAEVSETGAAGIAAIGLFMAPQPTDDCRVISLEQTVRALRQAFDAAGTR